VDDFIASLDGDIRILNEKDKSMSGIFNLLKYLLKIDLIFFNWIENVPDRKGGGLQVYFLYLLIFLAKALNVKIIWTMHNKLSHTKENYAAKEKVFRFMLKNSDIILTHSSAGKNFGEEMIKGSAKRIHNLPHPLKDRRTEGQTKKRFDILIWGTIAPYKGIDKFLEFLQNNKLENKYGIHIVGKIATQEYAELLDNYSSNKIEIQNKFIEDEVLPQLISQSNIVLFTYSQDSILSSGVLMDSLGYGANIIGPHVGAFADLAEDGIITTFKDFPDMIEKIDEQLQNPNPDHQKEKLEKFLEENSWNSFASNFMKLLNTAERQS
jgi:glycosyltransferase involved in cell wall biosynthesis